ncbi:MAG: hypothetical protein F6K10_08565 [Moorea sp. SIO2B7]|nr:hypothetical protein [Moorena sp. SIO2B7]
MSQSFQKIPKFSDEVYQLLRGAKDGTFELMYGVLVTRNLQQILRGGITLD